MAEPALHLHKSWHVLHYILCRQVEAGDQPLSWPVLGRAEVAPGLDDPPVRSLDPEAVFEAAAALNVAKFDILDELSRGDIAPNVYRWYEGYKSDLLPIFEALREYYVFAAENGMAMLIWRA